jgi:hypothetical protein
MEPVDTTNENVFTKRVRAGKRTYFFDVKATKSARDFYVIITESRRVGEEKYEKHKLFLYKEDFKKFTEALAETVTQVEGLLIEKIGQPVEVEQGDLTT